MPRVALTDRFCASVQSTTRENYFDTKVLGLALRVTPNGARSWWFVYRAPKAARRLDGTARPTTSQWLALGKYTAEALGLAEARKLASTYRHQVDVLQRDPGDEARAAKAAAKLPPEPPPEPPAVFTFADMAKLYVALAAAKKRTWKNDVQKLEKYLLPAWGPRPLTDITRKDVHALLDALVANGMLVGVNRVQALISRIFTVALDRSKIDAHPVSRMEKRFAEHPGEKTLTDAELRALCAGLEAQPGPAADAVRLRLLTGQRGAEVAGMAWAEVDLEAGLWQLPGGRTKNKRPHAVPLAETALAVVTRRRAVLPADEPRVFPALTLHHKDHRALATVHGGAYEWKDLRRTVASRLAELGFDETTIGRTLNHAATTVTAKHYNKHTYLAEKQAALEAWDRELVRILSGAAKPRKVLRHRPR